MKLKNDSFNYEDNTNQQIKLLIPKVVATLVVWVLAVGGSIASVAIAAGTLGEEVIGIVFMCLAAAVVTSGFIWNWGQLPNQDSHQQKDQRKSKDEDDDGFYDNMLLEAEYRRRRELQSGSDDQLAAALKKLSNDELLNLRDRVASGEISEQDLAMTLQEGKLKR